ncbi:MAG: hypothetical protein EOM37_05310 [Proteobacteria bacterium]|nr:hypothetical protein [Pseudomonadota bacterium]
MKKLALLLSALFVVSCAAPINHNTASGKVETTIVGTNKEAVKSKILGEMINKGYTMTKSDDVSIVFDKPVENAFAAALLGSRYDSTPNARITFNLIQDRSFMRIVADCSVITNPGSAFEKRTNMNNSQDTLKVQAWLDNIKNSFEQKVN